MANLDERLKYHENAAETLGEMTDGFVDLKNAVEKLRTDYKTVMDTYKSYEDTVESMLLWDEYLLRFDRELALLDNGERGVLDLDLSRIRNETEGILNDYKKHVKIMLESMHRLESYTHEVSESVGELSKFTMAALEYDDKINRQLER